jgi:putative transposase
MRGRRLDVLPAGPACESAQLQKRERQYAEFQEEHDLMRAAGLRGRAVRGYRTKHHIHALYARHPNRPWTAQVTQPNQVWVGDITYLCVGGHGAISRARWISIRAASLRGRSPASALR